MTDSTDASASALFDLAEQVQRDLDADRLQPLEHYLARFDGAHDELRREYEAIVGAPRRRGSMERGALIGPYRVIELLGRGGQGLVYRAEDPRLGRNIALKVLSGALAGVSHTRRERLRREAAILSRLEHPGICAVLDADLEGEVPYIAMRFIDGETLASALARERRERGAVSPTPVPAANAERADERLAWLAPRRALELAAALSFFERAARALHAAHEAGVVHRDVKPGNIMVGRDGAPVLLDFGLARADESGALLTRSGDVFGTPAYMSPEQLEGGRDLDRRTDVYSLGVVLYECLTLERPFRAESSAALAREVREHPLPAPENLNPALPRDLSIVLATALERDLSRRYASALELAEELRRVREYEPIHARPAGPLLRLVRVCQRHPALASATLGSIATLAIALVVALTLLARVQRERNDKQAALVRYQGAYYRDIAGSTMALWPTRAMRYAIVAAERDPGLSSNRVLLSTLESLYEKQVLDWPEGEATFVDIAPRSDRLLTACGDGVVRLWDPETGAELARFGAQAQSVWCARFDADARRIVSSSNDGSVRVWRVDAPSSAPLVLRGHTASVRWAEFSPDGKLVVSASRDHSVRLWDASSGVELRRFDGHTGNVSEARFVHGGKHVLTRSSEPWEDHAQPESDPRVLLFDVESGALLREFVGHTAEVRSMSLTRDGRWLATTSADHTARLYDLDSTSERAPAPTRVLEAPGRIHASSFSPDGTRLALGYDPGARIVEVATGRILHELPSHERRAVVSLCFDPSGTRLATVAYDSALRVFDVRTGALERICRGDTRSARGCAWSPDGQFLASWQRLARVDLWYGAERPFLQVLRGHRGEVVSARFDAGAQRVVTASSDGTARVWSALDGTLLRVIDAPDARATALIGARFVPGSEHLVISDAEGLVRVCDARSGAELARYDGAARADVAACVSPDGAWLALADDVGGTGGVRVVELASGASARVQAHQGRLTCLRFAPDGRTFASGGTDRRIRAWRVEGGAPLVRELWSSPPFEAQRFELDSVFDVAFDARGELLAAALQNMDVVLHDARAGTRLATARSSTIGRVAFARDGREILGTSKWVNSAPAWRIEHAGSTWSLAFVSTLETAGVQHANSITSLACASGADLSVTTSLDRSARLWDTRRNECIACYTGHTDAVWDADISADGERIVTASADGTARLWPGDLLATARRFEPRARVTRGDELPELRGSARGDESTGMRGPARGDESTGMRGPARGDESTGMRGSARGDESTGMRGSGR